MTAVASESIAPGTLARESLEGLRRSVPAVDRFLSSLSTLGRVVVVGGAVRDWIFHRAPRDLDVVVVAPPGKLAEFMSTRESARNRFGGYRLQLDAVRMDLWALADTWALKTHRLSPSVPAMVSTAFFNVDAIAMDVATGELTEHGFFMGFSERILSINHEPNPFPAVCIARAIVLARTFGLRPSEDFLDYFARMTDQGLDWPAITAAHRSHYGTELPVESLGEVLPAWAVARVV